MSRYENYTSIGDYNIVNIVKIQKFNNFELKNVYTLEYVFSIFKRLILLFII